MKTASVAAFVSCLLLSVVTALAQDSTVARAQTMRDAGDLAGAARLLQEHLASAPGDGEAARLLAQTLYWLNDVATARQVYEAALTRHPLDGWLRLDYARLLLETGDARRARDLLVPLLANPETRPDAAALLGTDAYWRGDLRTARQRFSEALAANPALPDAVRQLREIRQLTAPWLRLSSALWHDDQPLDRGGLGLEVGWHATPLTSLRLLVEPTRYARVGPTATTWGLEAEVRHFAPAARIELEAALGTLRRRAGDDTVVRWTGRGSAGVRAPGHVTLRGRVDRRPYLLTISALADDVVVRAIAGELSLDHPRGWIGKAVAQQQRFPDGNVVRTTYGWLLAPVVRHARAQVQAGYSVAFDDARDSRFVPARFEPGAGTSPLPSDLSGRYDPYYTPAAVERHAGLVAVTFTPSGRTTIRAGASRVIHAQEDVPSLAVDATGHVNRVFTTRDFSPWDARGSVEVRLNDGLTLTVSGESGRGSFYRWATGAVQLTYRFVGGTQGAAASAR